MRKRTILLKNKFFNRPVLKVAPELLGKYLVRRFPSGKISAHMIAEVEAYDGEKDLACHARNGKTKRTEVMYGSAGFWYVYLCYGMYHMLNIVTGPKNYPAAILIRGARGMKGPGIITRELDIKKGLNGKIALPKSGLWIEDRGIKIPKKNIVELPESALTMPENGQKYRIALYFARQMI